MHLPEGTQLRPVAPSSGPAASSLATLAVSMFVLLLAPSRAAAVQAESSVSTDTTSLAIVGVTVLPMDAPGRLIDATVLVSGDSIVAVGPRAKIAVPRNARIVDGSGRYLVPGFVDAHVHLRSGQELVSYLRHGVTTIWNLSGTPESAPDVLAARRAIRAGEISGPTIYTTGPVLDGDPPNFAAVSTVVTTPGEGSRAVAYQHRRGFDFIKVYNGLDTAVMKAVGRTAGELGMPVFGHIPRRPDRSMALQRALGAGLDVVTHAEEIFFTYEYEGVSDALDAGAIPWRDTTRIPRIVALLRTAGAAVIPNLSFVAVTRRQLDRVDTLRRDPDSILSDPESRYLAPETRQMWTRYNVTRRDDLERFDRRERAKYPYVQQLTRALASGGIPLFAGTDATLPGLLPGPSVHLEVHELVKAGLTPYEALRAATRDPAVFVERHVPGTTRAGEITPGARADLVLLAEDPLADITNTRTIEGVVVRGEWHSVDALDALREAAVR